MERGYIKMWRKIVDSSIFQNSELLRFWLWCLIKASHKKRKTMVGWQEVELLPGQFIFGRKAAATELKVGQRKVRTCLEHLKKSQKLTIKTTNKFSIVSIINWDSYQQDENKKRQLTDQQATSRRPAGDQQATTNKNVKNVKKKKLPPTIDEFKKYFKDNGYFEWAGVEAWKYYDAGNWYDSKGNKVRSWKQKVRGVWFKPENKVPESQPPKIVSTITVNPDDRC